MRYSTTLQKDVENWWKNLNTPMTVIEGLNDLQIGHFTFICWGDKHIYKTKTKCTMTYSRTFQSIDPVENTKGEIIYPILVVYIDICHGRKYTSYKKVRCRCSC